MVRLRKACPQYTRPLFTYKGLVAAGDANKYAHFHSAGHQQLTEKTYDYGMGDIKNGGVAVDTRAYLAGFNSNTDLVARIGHRSLSGSPHGRNIGDSASRKLDCVRMVYIE